MIRIALITLIGLLLIVLQTALLPRLLGDNPRPDLVLLLVLHLGLNERPLPGAFTAWLLGCLLDVFSGTTFGLYGLILLLIFCATSASGRQLNRDNAMVSVVSTVLGTTAHAVLLIATLLLFAEADQGWRLIFNQYPLQLGLNLLAALLGLPLFTSRSNRRGAPRRSPVLR